LILKGDRVIGDTNDIDLLNYYEGLAIGINQGLYDERLIYSTWESTMNRICICFAEYIDYRGNEGQIKAWAEFTQLVKKWDYDNVPRDKTGNI